MSHPFKPQRKRDAGFLWVLRIANHRHIFQRYRERGLGSPQPNLSGFLIAKKMVRGSWSHLGENFSLHISSYGEIFLSPNYYYCYFLSSFLSLFRPLFFLLLHPFASKLGKISELPQYFEVKPEPFEFLNERISWTLRKIFSIRWGEKRGE